ncbi:MAG: hypothetical protein JRJ03_16150 [Deltaproteobacteria bacterium]|nr:hypothetical protein [Deltaproteobacteria bacterium]
MNRKRVSVILLVLLLPPFLEGCSTGGGDCDRLRSELEKTKSELVTAKSLLDRTREELEVAKQELANAMAKLSEANKKILALEERVGNRKRLYEGMEMRLKETTSLCEKEKRIAETNLISALHEVSFLKQKIEELINGLETVSDELDVTRDANAVLQREIQRLTRENRRLRETIGTSAVRP